MKPVLVLENQAPDKLGYLRTWLTQNNILFEVHNAEIHGKFPNSINNYSALAVMGGAMSANDPLYTSRQAEVLILQAMYRDIPVIGHCLGGQLMAKALGAKIDKSPMPEIGWQDIRYVDDPSTQEWFGNNPTSKVMHWHYESFEIPNGAKLLASSDACPNQAFSIGKHLAMQFHIEIDYDKVNYWVSKDDKLWKTARAEYKTVQEDHVMLSESICYIDQHQKTADNIYKTWLGHR